ncbi:MAG: zinc ribbon domain-containing protein [Halobacteriales archaeon]|nr:zinc ribbon domain-containing protein [Halobacteriales archaeon]
MAGEFAALVFVWGAIAFAVAIDASRRGRHAGLWAVLTLFTGLFGAVLYGLVVLTTSDQPDDGTSQEGTEPETVRICPACASEHDDSPNYCDECGAELGPGDEHPVGRRLATGSRRYCSNCKSEIGREANACPNCGAVF